VISDSANVAIHAKEKLLISDVLIVVLTTNGRLALGIHNPIGIHNPMRDANCHF